MYLEGMKLDYTAHISNLRNEREKIINQIRQENGQEEEKFDYYPIDEKWKIQVESVKLRKPKEGMTDYNLKFTRVGKIDFTLQNNNPLKLDLYQLESDNKNYYVYLKDGTSGKTSYGLGRFVPVLKLDEEYFIDFNLAFTPACGHVEGSACPWARESTGVAIEAGEKAEKH